MRSAQAILRLALAYPLAVGVCVNGLAVGFAIRLPLEAMEGRPPPEGAAPVVVIALGTVCAIAAACGFGALAYLLFTVFFEREVLVLGNAVIPEAVRVECNVRVESRWNWPARLLMRRLHARVLKAEAIFTVEDGQ